MEKLEIWGERIPYNTGEEKKSVLHVDPSLDPGEAMAAVFSAERRPMTSTREFDTALWHSRILTGEVSAQFDDRPTVTPYLVPGSDICVLLCAGGAYIGVSTEEESAPVARELNRHGISAFTLDYRIYPYHTPTMFLDCRRALCFLRSNAEKFGFSPRMICLGGFSAGGNLAATTAALFRELPEIPDYTPDAVDRTDARPDALLLVYPKVLFTERDDLLIPILGEGVFASDRAEAASHYTIPPQLTADTPPAFLVNSQSDALVPTENLLEYAGRLSALGVPFELHSFLEGGHGFGSAREREYSRWAPPGDYRGTQDWCDLFSVWLRKIFYAPGKREYR